MYTEYTRNLCYNLIADGYYIASNKKLITEQTPVIILMKSQSPVLYMVNIINADFYLAGHFERQSKAMMGDVQTNLRNMYCSSCVSINILVSSVLAEENKKFCDEKVVETGERVSQVWWTADLNTKELYVGKEQPSKVDGIEKLVKMAFSGEKHHGNTELSSIVKEAAPKSALPVKSEGLSFTFALIFFNLFIFAYTYFSGNLVQFLKQFGCSYERIAMNGEFYRLLTSMFFHADWSHVLFNALSIYIFGSRCEKYIGRKYTVALYFASGVGAAILSASQGAVLSVGASGAVFGLIGAVLVLSRMRKREVGGISYFTILLYAMVSIGMGVMAEGVDNFAHVGGLLVGAMLQYVFVLGEDIKERRK
ncbi:MAG: rhomboid family intramembrane serine protease [Firmicutes bacterium]|nr:rhomboid family intramembrane serine protease [Bacillota bacterium]